MYKPENALEYAINKANEIERGKLKSDKTRQRIYAVCLDKKGRIVSESQNHYDKTHPYQYECACQVNKKLSIFLHAEIAALIKSRKPVHKIVVARVGAYGQQLLAKPCKICEVALKDYGVKSIEYTL